MITVAALIAAPKRMKKTQTKKRREDAGKMPSSQLDEVLSLGKGGQSNSGRQGRRGGLQTSRRGTQVARVLALAAGGRNRLAA